MKRGDKVKIIDKSPLACCNGKTGEIICEHPRGGYVVSTDHLCPEVYSPDGFPEGSDYKKLVLIAEVGD